MEVVAERNRSGGEGGMEMGADRVEVGQIE